MKNARAIAIVITCLLLALAFYSRCSRGNPSTEDETLTTKSDTTYIHDTIFIPAPTLADTKVIGEVESRLPIVPTPLPIPPDTTSCIVHPTPGEQGEPPDSVTVSLKVEQRHYSGEEYEAWVSGIYTPERHPELDSLRLYPATQLVRTTETKTRWKTRRWGLSVGAGAVATPNGKIQPGVFIGVTYTFLAF